MKRRRVLTLRALHHELQIGFLLKPGAWSARSTPKWRWRVADLADKHMPRQCWSSLVDWAMGLDREDVPLRDLRPRDVLPWRPQTESCRRDRDEIGACYCGKLVRADVVAERERLDAQRATA